MRDRYLSAAILEDLGEASMVFVGGPRQVGKTTLATEVVGSRFSRIAYFNWDNRPDRKTVMASRWPGDVDLIILDEFHKYRKWKSFIKGEYDKHRDRFKFMLTGSARMDVFRRGGDSLQGRYHHYRLHPFSLAELTEKRTPVTPFEEIEPAARNAGDALDALEEYGGFPAPLLKHSPRFLRRWHREKLERLFIEDVQDMERVRDIGSLKLLSDMLPERVGSLLSTNALREDLDVSFRAVSHWLDILENLYYHFRIYPYTSKRVRSMKKSPKLYLWDWSEVQDPGGRFENLVASHLLKLVHYLHDYEGYRAEVFFLRDLSKREVDFLVCVDGKPWFAVETKLKEKEVAPPLPLFKQKWQIPFCYQVVRSPGVDVLSRGIRVISADRFLASLK